MAFNDIMSASQKSDKEISNISEQDIKRTGSYEYVDTTYEGIKKIVGKQGGYLVFLDYGRRHKRNEKTGVAKYKQSKSVRKVETLAEARKLRREAEDIRAGKDPGTHKIKKVLFGEMVEDFKSSARYTTLSEVYRIMIDGHINHFMDFFADYEPAKISKIDIENYYQFQLERGNRNPRSKDNPDEIVGISINTIPKHKTTLKKLWKFMIDSKNYGVTENVAEMSEIPEVTVLVDGKEIKMKKIAYNATSLSIEELNYTLNDALQNEFDRSLVLAIALAALGSLRRAEVLALPYRNFYHDEFMDVSSETMEFGGFSEEYYKEHEELMLIDSAYTTVKGVNAIKLPKNNKVRIAAVPKALKEIADYALEQRIEGYKIAGKELKGTESMFLPLTYIFSEMEVRKERLRRMWASYQERRNERMVQQGLEPIPVIRFHDLRHTHANLLKIEVPQWEVSSNMGHTLLNANTTQKHYWNDREPHRKHIIDFFDENIKLDWDKAMRKPFEGEVGVNGSRRFIVYKQKPENPVTVYNVSEEKEKAEQKENSMSCADMIPEAAENIEKKKKDAVIRIVDYVNKARAIGNNKVKWNVPKEVDEELREMFMKKGYTFKTIPKRAGFYEEGEYLCW